MAQGDSGAWMHLRIRFLFFGGGSHTLCNGLLFYGESPHAAGESRDPSRTLTHTKKKILLAASKPAARSICVWCCRFDATLCFFFFSPAVSFFSVTVADARSLHGGDFSLRHERLRLGTLPTAGSLKCNGRRFTLWLFFFIIFFQENRIP